MPSMKRRFIGLIIFISVFNVQAIGFNEIRFNNEASDTTRINELLISAASQGEMTPNQIISFIGKQFIGTPYKGGTLEHSPERLTINMDSLDCTTFIDNVVAIAYTIEENRQSWRDFVYNMERFRYRNGELNGYASRLHYISDWIIDNTHRGNLKEHTDMIPQCEYVEKTLNFITTNRQKYPALTDSTEYERLKSAEIGFRRHRFPYIKASKLSNSKVRNALSEGDIVAITSKIEGLDVQHMGLIVIKNGQPHLLHASSKAGEVIIDPVPLQDYIRRNKNASGIRVIRLNL